MAYAKGDVVLVPFPFEAFIARRGLVPVHVSRSWGHYETVCRLPAGRPVAV